jgi:RNA recognition motif-containing protein
MATRTLFIGGFPPDFQERDLFNLFTFAPGFQNASLHRDRGGQLTAFVLFDSPEHARQALIVLNGRVVDDHAGSKLDAHMAQREFLNKREFDPYGAEGMPPAKRTIPAPPINPAGGVSSHYPYAYPPYVGIPAFTPTPTPTQNDHDIPPCQTLFVGKIPLNTPERDLRALFEACDGFQSLTYKSTGPRPCAFVEFKSVDCGTGALHQLHNYQLPGAKHPLNVSYAKKPAI